MREFEWKNRGKAKRGPRSAKPFAKQLKMRRDNSEESTFLWSARLLGKKSEKKNGPSTVPSGITQVSPPKPQINIVVSLVLFAIDSISNNFTHSSATMILVELHA